MIKYRITAAVPNVFSENSYELIDMRDIILWEDESASIIEFRRRPFNAAIGTPRILPPLENIAQLYHNPMEDDDEAFLQFRLQRMMQDLTDHSEIRHAANRIVDRIPSHERHRGYPFIRTMIAPAANAAFHISNRIIQLLREQPTP